MPGGIYPRGLKGRIRSLPYASVHSLRLVTCDEIDYSYKSTDRQCLNDLFAQRAGHDDILIIRDGLLTDTSICNVALWNGTSWITPARPLLCGTMRAYLLDKGLVQAEDIPVEDLPKYTRIRLFNALIESVKSMRSHEYTYAPTRVSAWPCASIGKGLRRYPCGLLPI